MLRKGDVVVFFDSIGEDWYLGVVNDARGKIAEIEVDYPLYLVGKYKENLHKIGRL